MISTVLSKGTDKDGVIAEPPVKVNNTGIRCCNSVTILVAPIEDINKVLT